jgi:hypothetical protein
VSYNVAPNLCLHASNFSSFLNNEGMPAERKKVLQLANLKGLTPISARMTATRSVAQPKRAQPKRA